MSAKKLDRKFVKPALISRHLNCSICTEVFLDPMRINCGHTFCKKCIDSWEKANNSCPICRGPLDKNLIGKDLIAEKIIQDFDVFCVNQLCEWKDKLENLGKHVKVCPYAKTPDWLQKAQSSIKIDEEPSKEKLDMYIEADENFIQRVNEEVSRKSLLERLYTKNLETKELVDSVFNTEKEPEQSSKKKKVRGRKSKNSNKQPDVAPSVEKKNSFLDYENFLCELGDSDEESKEDRTIDTSSKKGSTKGRQDELNEGTESLGKVLDFNSSKSTLEKDAIQESIMEEAIEEEVPKEETPKERNRRRSSRRQPSREPTVVKKSKTTVV